MTPDDLARIHALSFDTPRPWSSSEFSGLLDLPDVFLEESAAGFALGRVTVDEAELLTLAVDPAARRAGQGRSLLAAFEDTARLRRAISAHLEVSATNTPARALYSVAGYRQTGRRPGYYRSPEGARIDALLLAKALD